ncbi:MAG: TIGR02281 family clan AA aspartic protease [Sphingomonadales bacterium]|nr:TIGR02281 family clan AA aspartic protease [Sphingomonadales bacterium]
MNGLGELASVAPLLFVAVAGIVLAGAGWMLENERPAQAIWLRRTGYLALGTVLLLQIGLLALQAERSDASMELNQRPSLHVSGSETIIPMASDGHFWVTALVNGKPLDFLIDTGATYTGIGRTTARNLGITPDPRELPLELETANGVITARLGTVETLRFGNIAISGLQVAVPDQTSDDTQVIGMNLLSQLGSWRVEGDKLILVPQR